MHVLAGWSLWAGFARTDDGVQPSLDGLRAVSVVAVLLYHAGFGWMHGGFLGVEVLFVVSGFLITALLIEERDRSGGISLRRFGGRRARRLLPALLAMLFDVVVVVLSEYCTDDVIATDSKHRWDGVHASGKGVKFTFGAIALPLLQIPLGQGEL